MTGETGEPQVLIDKATGERYQFIIEEGRRIFAGSPLTTQETLLTAADLALIDTFHQAVSPTNPAHPWRLKPEITAKTEEEAKTYRKAGKIVDTSFYANWDEPGGPREHVQLATAAGEIITRFTQSKLKDSTQKEAIEKINPYLLSAAAALHDDGRLVTHLPSNEPIGKRLLRRMGIREDLVEVIPDENIMLVPKDMLMETQIMDLKPEAILLYLADNFGKRCPRTNRLYQPSDFTSEKMTGWAKNYAKRPVSGRPLQRLYTDGLPLHVENIDRLYQAFDYWIQAVSTSSLQEVATHLNQQLAPTLVKI